MRVLMLPCLELRTAASPQFRILACSAKRLPFTCGHTLTSCFNSCSAWLRVMCLEYHLERESAWLASRPWPEWLVKSAVCGSSMPLSQSVHSTAIYWVPIMCIAHYIPFLKPACCWRIVEMESKWQKFAGNRWGSGPSKTTHFHDSGEWTTRTVGLFSPFQMFLIRLCFSLSSSSDLERRGYGDLSSFHQQGVWDKGKM